MPASLLDIDTAWYNVKLPLRAAKLSEIATFSISKERLDELYAEAQSIVDAETKLALGSKKGWYMNQFQTRGTTADRIAAAAVKLSSSDCMLHLDSFTLLFDVARNDAHHFESALKALAAVWPKVLPPRPLKRFAAQYFATLPTDDDERRRKVICFWYIEDTLKRTYAQFLAIMESSLKDNLLIRRQGWLDVSGKLLNGVAEARNIVIAMVVDKLGDPIKTIAHQSYHLLLGMLSESSTNQSLLMTELEKLAFQRNCPAAAQKYCINVMNQLVFNKNERKLALKAVASYLSLFKQCIVQGHTEQSVTSGLIVGLRRAFPFAGADMTSIEPHLDALFVLANTGPFLQRVSTLAMIQQLLGKGGIATLESRFYRALYASLLVSPHALPHSSQLTVFFTTLYKAIREDKNNDRVIAFVHRLLQRCMVNSDPFVCASLLLVAEMCKAVPQVAALLKPRVATGASAYQPTAREPAYARAQDECLWVLTTLTRHTHPSVVKLAILLVVGEEISYDLHPLDDLTLTNFLGMFADVEIDPNSSTGVTNNKGVPVFRRQVRVAALPRVSDRTFVEAAPDHVDAAHLFMHRYAHQRERFIARRSEPTASAWESQAELEAKDLQPTTEALFGPVLGGKQAAAAMTMSFEENEALADDFDEADDLNWGDEEQPDDDEDDDDDGGEYNAGDDEDDDPDGTGLTEMLEMSTKPKSRRETANEAWLDQAEKGIARGVHKRAFKPPQTAHRGRPQPRPRR